jgi:iron uptake system component EfeO
VSRRLAALFLVVPVALVACSSGSKSGSSAGGPSGASKAKVQTIDISLSDRGCDPRAIPAQSGPTTFHVSNDNSAAVTEFEVLSGSRILGEVENVIPGADKSFSLNLKSGSFTTSCPGGSDFDHGTLAVADAPAGTAAAANPADQTAATNSYLVYVKAESDKLIVATQPFVAAVKAGNMATAKTLFAPARAHYESIEPIAESFGDLDPQIDARQGDVPDAQWGGFHRIEKALWMDNNLAGMSPVADKLMADVKTLRTSIDTVKVDPSQISNGALELLDEVSTSKISGEEDRYSHTDLSDFSANLAGSKEAFDSVKPLLAGNQSALATQITAQFAAVQAALDHYKGTDPTGNGYVLYNALTKTDTRMLSGTLDALSEPMSKVAAAVL